MKKIVITSSILIALPLVASAQGTLAPIQSLIVSVGNIIALLIPISIGAAMLVFFYGLFKYIRKPDDKEGSAIMLRGIASLFIMVSIWGIIHLVQTALLGGTSPTTQVSAPHFPTN